MLTLKTKKEVKRVEYEATVISRKSCTDIVICKTCKLWKFSIYDRQTLTVSVFFVDILKNPT